MSRRKTRRWGDDGGPQNRQHRCDDKDISRSAAAAAMTTADPFAISAAGLVKTFGAARAVDGLDLTRAQNRRRR